MSKVARLQQEVNGLRHEMAILRFDRDELYRKHGKHFKRCAGGDCCKTVRLDDDDAMAKSKVSDKDLYIAFLEDQIKQTRLKYKRQMGDVKSSATVLESKLQKVRQEIFCITARARQVDMLKKDVEVLKAKLQRRNTTIAQHKKQYAGLMGLISSLDQSKTNYDTSVTFNQMVSDHYGKEDNESTIVLEKKPKPKLNFDCLNAALKKKVTHK